MIGGFEIGKVHCMECLEGMQSIPDNSIDLTVTSPPYNCGIEYDVYKDDRPWEEYLSWCSMWLSELYRITQHTGRICVNVLLDMGMKNNKIRVSPFAEFYRLINQAGFKMAGSPVWTDNHRVKYTDWGSWLKSSSPYIYCPYEVIIIAYKGEWKRNNGVTDISKEDFMMGCSGVWNIKTQISITKANFHEDLPALCIKLLSGKDDLVFDPFAGAGTTGVAAKRNQRRFIGFELSEEYTAIANNRIQTTGKSAFDRRAKCQ